MALRMERLEDTTGVAFEELLAQAWGQNWGPRFARELVEWRYYQRPSRRDTWLAMDGKHALPSSTSSCGPTFLTDLPLRSARPATGFALRRTAPSGIGIRPMRQMMAYPEPILSIGGTEATLAILPRLGWQPLAEVQSYVLPVKMRNLAGTWLRRNWPTHEAIANAIPNFIPFHLPRRAPPPLGCVARTEEWQPGTAIPMPLPERQGLVQILEQADQDWIAKMPPWLARPLGLLFFAGENLVGFSLSQLEPAVSGFDGCIVHLQTAHETQPVVDWIVGETAWRLATRGAGIVRCYASSAAKIAALEKAGFSRWMPRPSYWWHREGTLAPRLIDASSSVLTTPSPPCASRTSPGGFSQADAPQAGD